MLFCIFYSLQYLFAVCVVACVRKGSIILYMMKVNLNGWTYRAKYENHIVLVSVVSLYIFFQLPVFFVIIFSDIV